MSALGIWPWSWSRLLRLFQRLKCSNVLRVSTQYTNRYPSQLRHHSDNSKSQSESMFILQLLFQEKKLLLRLEGDRFWVHYKWLYTLFEVKDWVADRCFYGSTNGSPIFGFRLVKITVRALTELEKLANSGTDFNHHLSRFSFYSA